jgi:hypothetical protein
VIATESIVSLDLTAIILSGFATLGVILAAWLPTRKLHQSLGKKNGEGTVTEMLERILRELETLRQHDADVDAKLRAVEAAVAARRRWWQ